MANLSTSYADENGNQVDLTGESVEEIAAQLPEDFTGDLVVRDEPGFVRGWVHSRTEWRAQ
jgi:hypothetical protein